MKQAPHKPSAFTLLELMVSVLIIAGLAFLAFQGMRSISARGVVARCTQNLRQMGIGIAAYAAEHRGDWPYYEDKRPNVSVPGTWLARNLIEEGTLVGLGKAFPYLRDKRLFVCPANKASLADLIKEGDFASEEGRFRNSYSSRGINQSHQPSTPNMTKLATIGYRSLVACNFAYAPRNPANFPLSWHDGAYPVLFSDGSVSLKTLPADVVNPKSPPNINDSNTMQIRIWDYFDGKTATLQF